MDWLLQRFEQNIHPLTDLLLEYRSLKKSTNSSSYPLFLTQIPTFDKKAIQDIISKIKSGATLVDSFAPYIKSFIYDENTLSNILDACKECENPNQLFIDGVLMYALTLVLKSDTPNTQKTLLLLCSLFQQKIFKSSSKITLVLYISFVDSYLNDENFNWDNDSIIACSSFIPFFEEPLPSSLIFGLLKASHKNSTDAGRENIINSIITVIIDRQNYFTKEEIFKLISLLDYSIKKLDPRALRLLAILSNTDLLHPIKDGFVIISSVYVNMIIQEPVFISNSEFIESSPVELKESEFKFHSCDEKEFEMGFSAIKYEDLKTNKTFKNFLSPMMFDKVQKLCESIEQADIVCLDCFFTSIVKIITAYRNDPHIYDLITNEVILISHLASSTPILPLSEIFFSQIIFNPNITVFSEKGASETIKFLRASSINTLASSAQTLLADLLIQNSTNQLLFAEIIGHIIYCETPIDNSTFLTDPCLQSIAEVISYLWSRFDKSPKVKLAFNTIMSFIFSLMTNSENKEIIFSSPTFCKVFLLLATESKLMNTVFVTIRNYLLANESDQISAVTKAFANLYSTCSKFDRTTQMQAMNTVKELGNMIIYVLSHNPKFGKNLKEPLDAMMDFGLISVDECASQMSEIINQILKFFSMVTQSSPFYELISMHLSRLVNVIKMHISTDNERIIMQNLINITACSNSLTFDSLFIIKVPTFLPVFLAAFGEFPIINNVIKLFTKLCKYSPTNCRAMHDSGIDSILIDYVSKKDEKLFFKGTTFSIKNVSEDDAFGLLWLITREKSSYPICLQIMKLIISPPNKEMASRILAAQTGEATSKQKYEFQLGLIQPFAIMPETPSTLFNKKMTFCFWIKVDESQLSIENTNINILKVYNELQQNFSFFIHRGLFYISFNDMKDPENNSKTSLGSINSNSWGFCAFVIQRISLEKSIVGFFANHSLLYANEVNAIMFDQDLPLTFEIGGDGVSQISNNAILGPFAFANTMLTEENLQSIEKRGTEAFNEENFIVSTNMIQESLPTQIETSIGTKLHLFYVRNAQHSLHFMLGKGNHMLSLIQCFSKDFEVPEGFLEIIIGLIKTTLSENDKFQKEFHGFPLIGKLLEKATNKLSYQLYMAFFSLLDSFTEETIVFELFDGIIMNLEIWKQTTFFQRVVNHWSHNAVAQCINLFKRQGYFINLLNNFRTIYEESRENKKLINSYNGLLENAGTTFLTSKDFNQLFIILTAYFNEIEFSLYILNLIALFAKRFSKSPNRADKENLLLNLIPLATDINVIIGIVQCLHNYSYPNTMETMLAAGFHLNRHPEKEKIFIKLSGFATDYPGFYTLYCILPLSLPYTSKQLAAASLSLISTLPLSNYTIQDDLWYVWPILLSMFITEDAFQHVVQFLTHFSTKDNIEQIIITAQLIMSMIYVDKCDLLINLFDHVGESLNKEYAIFLYQAFFFRFTNIPFSYTLLEEFNNSPFKDSVSNIDITPIKDLLTFDELLRGNFDHYDVRFGLSSAPNVLDRALSILGKFALISMSNIGKQISEVIKRKTNLDILADLNVTDLTLMFSQKYRSEFIKKIDQIHKTIVISKNRIAGQLNLNNILGNYIKKEQDLITPLSVDHYYNYMTNFDLGKTTRVPSSHTLCGFIPLLSCLSYFDESFCGETEEVNISDINFSSKNFVSLPINIINNDQKEFAFIFMSETEIFIVSQKKRVKLFNNDSIRCIFKRPPSSLEFVFYENCSLLFDFNPLTIEEVVVHIGKINANIVNENIENLIIFNSNFERFMVAQYFEGFSIYKSDNLPTIDGKNYKEFCDIENIDGKTILSNRLSIEGSYTNSLNRQSFVLHLQQNQILSATFFGKNLAIFMKNGEVNIYKLLLNTMPELSNTFSDIFLDDSCIIAPGKNSLTITNRSKMTVVTIWDIVTHSNVTKLHEQWCKDGDTPAWISSTGCISVSGLNIFIPEKVCSFVFSQSAGILAASTDKCRVYVHSIFRHELFSYIELQQQPDSMLVTNSSGCVVIAMNGMIKVYTATGKFLGEINENAGKIIKFVMKGIDFIAFCNSSNVIKCCCIYDLTKTFAVGEVKSRVIDMTYIEDYKTLFVMCTSGKIHMLPVNYQ